MRNVIAYADARTVRVELTRRRRRSLDWSSPTTAAGSTPEVREERLAEGHLGLSLVEELARQSGGSLEVTSTEGVGTRVELEVPNP